MAYRRKDSPYWWVKYTDASGQRTDRSTGTTDRKEAQALEAKWRLEAHQMRQWGVQPEHTFDELMLAYLKATSDTMRDPERATYAIQRLRPFFTGRVMERLRRADVSAYIEKRKADKVGPYTVNRELDLLSAAINYARKHWEWDIQNPVSGMSLRQPEGRLRWLSRAEADVLIREAEKEPKSPHLADFIRLALNTGCRKNELLKLSWDRVDLKANVLRLEGEHTKSGKRRAVPLNDEARRAFLNRARIQTGYSLTGTGSAFGSCRTGFRRRARGPRSRASGSTICGTRSPPGSCKAGCRCSRSRSSSATRPSRWPSVTRTWRRKTSRPRSAFWTGYEM